MPDNDDRRNDRDMILTAGEHILIRDDTKGEVSLYVGPNKTSLATTDKPVILDPATNRFKPCDLTTGTRAFVTAKEGEYIVLENPAEGDRYPSGSGKLTTPPLSVGKKVNIPGPASFALWPGQLARVVSGHSLRSNEYLVVRVYDEEAAKANWKNAVIKTQQTDGTTTETRRSGGDIPTADQMSMGKLFVIRGTQVSFYVPATGVEVVPEHASSNEERFVREAVSLEVLEYALLLDQDGTKRYEHGPQVVFPRPTERFVEAPIKSDPQRAKAKKFRYQELTPQSGIHVRVISYYEDDDGASHEAGEELFITGETTAIYRPRAEHAIIKNGEADLHFAVVIPPGEARYVLDKGTGEVSLIRGSRIFLPDPRKQVIVSRALPLGMCELLYPGNATARAVNAARLGTDDQDIHASGSAEELLGDAGRGYENYSATVAVATQDSDRRVMIRGASKAMPGDSFDRKGKFKAPRSVVLRTTYDGAVNVDVWTGYAVLLISKNGDRRVVRGPQTAMLEYDEMPQVMTLSRGKPKNMDNPLRTAYLLTQANMVSDLVEVVTKDFCALNVKLAYRVNFEGDDHERWFAIENYVKFLCDHMRSRIRAAIQKIGIEEFHADHTRILRDVILGQPAADGGARVGTTFAENGMRIYDAEILGVELKDQRVAAMLIASQQEVIQNALGLAAAKRKLAHSQELEEIRRQTVIAEQETSRQISQATADTERLNAQLAAEAAEQRHTHEIAEIEAARRESEERSLNDLAAAEAAAKVGAVNVEAQATIDEAKHAAMERSQALRLETLKSEVEAVVAKASAVSPDLIAALTAFGDKALIGELSKAMAPLGILGGKSVVDAARQLLEGSPLARYLDGSHAAALVPIPAGAVVDPSQDAPATVPQPRARVRRPQG